MTSLRAASLPTLFIGIFLNAIPSGANADGVVGNGTAASCTEAALIQAIDGAGPVWFDCGATPVTIVLTSPLTPLNDVDIDGGNLVTLSGSSSTGILYISQGLYLNLFSIKLQHGSASDGGAIYNDGGTLGLTSVTLNQNQADNAGGAIYNTNGGSVNIIYSELDNNFAGLGGAAVYNTDSGGVVMDHCAVNNNFGATPGAVYSDYRLKITASSFDQNQSEQGAAVYLGGGELFISDSTFTGNAAIDGASGGAIYIEAGTAGISDSSFTGNTNLYGGAIDNFGGHLTISDSHLDNNTADLAGGALHNSGTIVVVSSTINGNTVNAETGFGGGVFNNGGMLTIADTPMNNHFADRGGALFNDNNGTIEIKVSTLEGNSANHGGTLYNVSGDLTLTGVTISNSLAAGSAGAIYNNDFLWVKDSEITHSTADQGGAIYHNAGTLQVEASTLYDNGQDFTPTGQGGAIFIQGGQAFISISTLNGNLGLHGGALYLAGGSAVVASSTVAGNSGPLGGGAIQNAGDVTLRGSIIADNLFNGVANCAGGGTFTSSGYNLSDDASCGLTAAGDIENSASVSLGALADNGGPTLTLLPAADSDALLSADCTVVQMNDQRYVTRPFPGIQCDIGAVDQQGVLYPTTIAVFDTSGIILEGDSAGVDAVVSGPVGSTFDYTYDCDRDNIYETAGTGSGLRGSGTCSFADEGSYFVVAKACMVGGPYCTLDGAYVEVINGAPVVAPPVVTPVSSGVNAFSAQAVQSIGTVEGTTVVAHAEFTDPGVLDTHVCRVDYGAGDGAVPGTVEDNICIGPAHTYLDDHPFGYVVTVMVTDDAGSAGDGSAVHPVHNAHPGVSTILAPIEPVPVGATVAASLTFTDAGVLDTHEAQWDWGDGSSTAATIVESGGSGTATGEHVYEAAGKYLLSITLLDDDTGYATTSHEHVLVFDANGGSLTGAGMFESPEGAYLPDDSIGGRARFTLNARYRNHAAPDGAFSLRLPAADLNFASMALHWLSVDGNRAELTGEGAIDGTGPYGFSLTAIDGNMPGKGGGDALRVRIWEIDEGRPGPLLYDNGSGGEQGTHLLSGAIEVHP